MFTLLTAIAELGDGSVGVSKKTLLVSGIDPGAGDHACAIARANLVFVGVYQDIECATIHQALFNKKRFESFDAESQIGRNGLVLVMLVPLGRRRGIGSHGNSAGVIAPVQTWRRLAVIAPPTFLSRSA
jgi:hypothetical protein